MQVGQQDSSFQACFGDWVRVTVGITGLCPQISDSVPLTAPLPFPSLQPSSLRALQALGRATISQRSCSLGLGRQQEGWHWGVAFDALGPTPR